jgi:hypothetical protein
MGNSFIRDEAQKRNKSLVVVFGTQITLLFLYFLCLSPPPPFFFLVLLLLLRLDCGALRDTAPLPSPSPSARSPSHPLPLIRCSCPSDVGFFTFRFDRPHCGDTGSLTAW